MNAVLLFLQAVPRTVLYLVIAALSALTVYDRVGLAVADQQISSLQAEYSKNKAQWESEKLAAAESARAQEAAQRLREQNLTTRLQDAETQLESQREDLRRTAAALSRTRTERDGLRDQIAGYASGGAAAADTLTAARNRADRLGRLLGESLRVQEELAGGAESEAANVRALLGGWPK